MNSFDEHPSAGAAPDQLSMGQTSAETLMVILAVPEGSLHPAVRAALERDGGLSIVAEKSTATRALGAVLMHRPHVCLIDVDLPGDICATIESIVHERRGTRIGILARSADEPGLVRAVLAGANGVLLTSASPETFATEVQALAHGERVLPPQDRLSSEAGELIEAREPGTVEGDEDELSISARRVAPLTVPQEHREDRLISTLLYVPRFSRHLRRRLSAHMPLSVAWSSARERMMDYR